MARIQRNPLPAPLRPEDVGNQEVTICRVKEVRVDIPVDQENNRRGKATVMLFHEYEGKGLYLNATSLDAAVQGFASDETDHWLDKQVPVIRIHYEFVNKRTGTTQSGWNLGIAPAEMWAQLFKEAKQRTRAGKS